MSLVSRFWSEEDGARAERFGLKTRTPGFITVEAWNCEQQGAKQLTFEAYEAAVVGDGPAYETLEGQTDRYFKDHLHPFPYVVKRKSRGQAAAQTEDAGVETDEDDDPWHRRMLSTIAGFRVPADFFQVHLDMIMRRDGPEGVDGDIRGLILVLRYVYGRNLWRLIRSRRSRATWASLLIVLSFAAVILGLQFAAPQFMQSLAPRDGSVAGWLSSLVANTSLIQYGAVALVGLTIAYLMIVIGDYPKMTNEYQVSINASCANVRSTVVGRFSHLRNMTRQMHDEIPKKDKYGERWQKAATRWSRLAIWMSMRAQHLESFFQLEMWRIRRMEAWLRFMGYVATVTTLAGAILAMIAFVIVLGWNAPVELLPVYAVAALPAIYYLQHINRVVFRKQRTGRSILEDNLGAAIKPGAGDAELPELGAQTISELISRVRELEHFLVGHAGAPAARRP